MKKMQIVRNYIKTLPENQEFTFRYVRDNLNSKDISTTTLRKYLHRLQDEGLIEIIDKSLFKKTDENFEAILFVYGSLKKGFDNNRILNKAIYISKAQTVRKFAMYRSEEGDYPYLVKNKSLYVISGEIYKIKRKDLMKKIDLFEGSPDYYLRESINVKTRSGNKRAFAYFYIDKNSHKNKEPIKEWLKPEKFDIDAYYQSIMESIND
jgi:gamma-glutamylaminecyclotransferase